MITVPENVFIWFNVAIVVFYIVNLILGYKKGFIKTFADTFGILLAIFAAWLLGPVLAGYAKVWPKAWTPMQDTLLSEVTYDYVNRLFWYAVIFLVVFLVLFVVLRSLAKVVQKIPVISQANGFLGSLFSVVTSTLCVLLISFVFSTPLFSNGVNIRQNTFFEPISQVLGDLNEPLKESEALAKMISNFDELTDSDREYIRQWFERNGYDDFFTGLPNLNPEEETPVETPSEDPVNPDAAEQKDTSGNSSSN